MALPGEDITVLTALLLAGDGGTTLVDIAFAGDINACATLAGVTELAFLIVNFAGDGAAAFLVTLPGEAFLVILAGDAVAFLATFGSFNLIGGTFLW